ncbi:hypothetical protein V8D89_007180 [Ganoderma adspersum]
MDDVWSVDETHIKASEQRVAGMVGNANARKELRAGEFIWIIPETMTSEESRELEEHGTDVRDLREIMKIGWHEECQKFIYECCAYLRGDKMEECGPFDNNEDTMSLTRIEDLVNVAEMNAASVNFKTLCPGACWMNWQVTKAPDVFCTHECKLGRIYVPDRQEMWWCKSCRRWIHTECQQFIGVGGEFFNYERVVRLSLAQSQYRWLYVYHVRIAHVPQCPNLCRPSLPHTIETTVRYLLKARNDFRKKGKRPPDFKTYLNSLVNYDGLHTDDKVLIQNEVLEIIDQAPAQDWYQCMYGLAPSPLPFLSLQRHFEQAVSPSTISWSLCQHTGDTKRLMSPWFAPVGMGGRQTSSQDTGVRSGILTRERTEKIIWVVPVDTTPTRARRNGLDLIEHKTIEEIAWCKEKQQYIYKCLDYVHASDVEAASKISTTDQERATLVCCLGGQHELIKTSQVSYVARCHIEDITRIATLEANTVTFPPLFPYQPYSHMDASMDYKTNKWKGPWFVTDRTFEFCTPACVKQYNYTPHEDEMRWCPGPCQRGEYPKVPVLFSLEKLITMLCEQGTTFSRTTDRGLLSFEEAVNQVIADEEWPMEFSSSLFTKIVKAVDSFARQKTYQCTGRGCWEWI